MLKKKTSKNFIPQNLIILCGIFLTFIFQIEKINSFTNGNFNPKIKLNESIKEYIKFHENKEKEEKDFLGISYFADEIVKSQSDQEKKDEKKKEQEKYSNFLNENTNCLDSEFAKKNSNLSDNQKFILGKCNPVIFVPGFLSTRLVANFNCPELVKDKEAFDELKFFCGKTVCKKGIFSGYEKEEYTLWPSLFNNPFKMYIDGSNPDNACMSYVMRIFNDEKECPKLNLNKQKDAKNTYNAYNTYNKAEKPICLNSKYIKVTYSGNTEKTKDSLQCGVKPISRILDSGYSIIPESSVNSGSTAVYYEMKEFLKSFGYSEGFSMAGLPYDFRVLSKKNSNFSRHLVNLVEMLFNNTGKKVIIASHSLGNIFTNDVLVNPEFKEKLEKMIERNIAILPPYIGTSKDTELFLTGTKEFKVDLFAGMKIDISESALKFMSAFNPNFYILFLQPFLENLSTKKEYKNFLEGIMERIQLERDCRDLIALDSLSDYKEKKAKGGLCTDDFIEKNSKKFNALFPFIPKLNSPVCKNLYKKAIENMKNSDFFNTKEGKRFDIYEYLPTYDPCFLRIFDFLNCPLLKVQKEKDPGFPIEQFEKFCIPQNEENEKEKKEGKFFNEK